jgi:hypothetical protein
VEVPLRARPEAESVDILPLLNVVVLLIPFTLLGASFVEIREVGVFAPAEGPGVDGSDPLVVDVFADRLVVHSGGGAEQGRVRRDLRAGRAMDVAVGRVVTVGEGRAGAGEPRGAAR